MFTPLRGSFYGWLSRSSGFISTRKKHSWNFQPGRRLEPLPLKLSSALAAPQHLIHIHFLIPPFSSFAPLRAPVYSCHRPAFICPASAVSCVHCVASPDKLKFFTSKPGENSSAVAATLLLPIMFFGRGLMLVNGRHSRRL